MKQLPTVLIVDDIRENLILLETIIRKINVIIISSVSPFEALKKTRGIVLALAIIDVRMPGMNGYELALKLNEERSGDKVPIIFLTASHFSETESSIGYSSGAADYIFKPINNHILLSKINVFLELFNQKQIISSEASLLKKSLKELARVNVALQKSEEKYRSYIDSAPDGVFVVDETGRYIEVNEAACRITGYSESELLKISISDILAEESLKEGLDHFTNVIKTGASKGNLSFRHKNGSKRWWSVEAVKLSEKLFLGFAEDITSQIEMEDALRSYQLVLEMQNNELTIAIDEARVASQKYSDLYDFAPSGYFTLSAEKEILDLNFSGALMLGRERSLLISGSFGSFISRSTLSVFNAFFLNIFKSNTKEICEVILETENYPSKHVHIEGLVVGNGNQCLINVVDITAIRKAETTLKVSEEKYRTMVNASPDGILLTDLHGNITEISEIALELFGVDSRDDMVGEDIIQFVPSDEKNIVTEIFEKTLNEGLVQNVELIVRKKNNSLFAAETSATLIKGQDGVPLSLMIIVRDISHRKKMETKQIHADRMANLGEMASGIAHEINQPLNIISMVMDKILFETAKTKIIDVEFLKSKAEKIFENITRIKNIIDHIRAFSRSHDGYIPIAFDVNESIVKAISMVAEQFKYLGISLDIQLEKEIPMILGNTYKLEQVIINLLVNAKDAVIERKAKQEEFSEMIIGIRSYSEKKLLKVEVEDNGIGIPDDNIKNIMLPFYTSKDAGKGTGLGLSICYQIVKEMEGTIDVISGSLSGTIIRIILKP